MEGNNINQPLVSVIIPAYNAGSFIADTVNSVLVQTYPNIEIIVVDDSSTDNTAQILGNVITSRQLLIVSTEVNSGAASARNYGYKLSKGKFIKFLDGDDLINPEMIAAQVQLTLAHENCIISGKWGRFYNNDTGTFKLNPEDCWQSLPPVEWICSSWKNAQAMTNPGIFLIPRTIINQAGLWDEDLSLLDDTEYFSRTMLPANKIIFCANAILYYRSGNTGSLSGKTSQKHALSGFNAVLKSTTHLLNAQNTPMTRKLCANSLQQLYYSFYPGFPDICNLLQNQIKVLGGSSIKWHSSASGELLSRLIGWKTAKLIQHFKKKIYPWH